MRRLIITAAAALAIAISGTAIAFASIPDSSGVIHGCYTVKGGSLRVIDTAKGQTCLTGQHALNWNQKGPQGPAGPLGPAGVSGYSIALCTVAEDSNGNLFVVSSSGGTCSPSGVVNHFDTATLICPAGRMAISSSQQPDPAYGALYSIWSYLNASATGYEWGFDVVPGARADLETTCANAS